MDLTELWTRVQANRQKWGRFEPDMELHEAMVDLAPEAYEAMGEQWSGKTPTIDYDLILDYLESLQPPEQPAPQEEPFDINKYINKMQEQGMQRSAPTIGEKLRILWENRPKLSQDIARVRDLPWKKNPGGMTAITR